MLGIFRSRCMPWAAIAWLAACDPGMAGTIPPSEPTEAQATEQGQTAPSRQASAAGKLDEAALERALGRSLTTKDTGVLKATWPRTKVAVQIDGMSMPPPAGLTSWAAFKPLEGGDTAMVMGDTVVFEDEVDAAMDAAFEHDLSITALHNHFFFDEPAVYFMHIGGQGEPQALARGVGAMWDAIAKVRSRSPQPADRFDGPTPKPGGKLDAQALAEIVQLPHTVTDGVVKFTVGRTAEMEGTTFGGDMGTTTWAAFTGSDALASIDGDFAMKPAEVQPVLRALRKADIHVVALHNHMIGEHPPYYFTHFWATGPAAELARGFRSALEVQFALNLGAEPTGS